MRILLVHPPFKPSDIGFYLAAMPEPLALETVAATVPGHEVRIFDMRFDSGLMSELENFSPEVVGVTALTTEVYSALNVLLEVKGFSPDIFTVIGGIHATLLPDDFKQPQVNAIAAGEAEFVFPYIIDALSGKSGLDAVPGLIWRHRDGHFIHNPLKTMKLNMDELLLPRRDLTAGHRKDYFFLGHKPDTSMATGRGCPHRCNFCSVWVFYNGKTRQMSPRRVLEEIRSIENNFITFVDDNFMMNYKRENAIADLLMAEGIHKKYFIECRTDSIARHPDLLVKWKKAGLQGILFGLEGSSDKALSKLNKRNKAGTNDEAIRICNDNDVGIWGAFIVDPDWDRDDFTRLRDYIEEKRLTHVQLSVLTPLPGTQLYKERFNDLLTHNYTCFDNLHSVLPTRLPREQFYEHFAALYKPPDISVIQNAVRKGKMTMDDVRQGKEVLDRMSNPEFYFKNDPVLGHPADT